MKSATVYSGPRCTWCDRVKVLLQQNGYAIEEKSIVDKGLIEEFQNKFNQTLRTVPQVVIDDKLIGGFAETEALIKGPLSINKI
jgi:glutaredoxin